MLAGGDGAEPMVMALLRMPMGAQQPSSCCHHMFLIRSICSLVAGQRRGGLLVCSNKGGGPGFLLRQDEDSPDAYPF